VCILEIENNYSSQSLFNEKSYDSKQIRLPAIYLFDVNSSSQRGAITEKKDFNNLT